MRYRTKFAKTEAMRFTGNLDLHRTLERTMRRADLPLTYSQGFNPRPKLTLADALPLGYTSADEIVDFWLDEDLPLEAVQPALEKAAPPGIQFFSIEAVDSRTPKLQNTLASAVYQVTLLEAVEGLETKVAELLAAPELPRQKTRKGKVRHYDLRALILDIQPLPPDRDGNQRLEMHLQARPGATTRPDEILAELGADPLEARVHRTALVFTG